MKRIFLLLIFITLEQYSSTVKITDMKNNRLIGEIEKNKPFNIQKFKQQILKQNKDIDNIDFALNTRSDKFNTHENALLHIPENCDQFIFLFYNLQSNKSSPLTSLEKIFVDGKEMSISPRQIKFNNYKSNFFILISDINKATNKQIAVAGLEYYVEFSDEEKSYIEETFNVELLQFNQSNIFWFPLQRFMSEEFHFYTKEFLFNSDQNENENNIAKTDELNQKNNVINHINVSYNSEVVKNQSSNFQLLTTKNFGIALFLCAIGGYLTYYKFIKKKTL